MGRKKKGYQHFLGDAGGGPAHVSFKAKGGRMSQAEVALGQFDQSYLMMLVETTGGDEEAERIQKSAQRLVEGRSLLALREDLQAVSQRSQGGGNRGQKSVADYICFLFLGSQFSQVKKYTQSVLVTLDEKTVLNTLENIIIEFACSDEFEIGLNSLRLTSELMRTFEYKVMAYLEVYHKLIEQNPLADDGPSQIQKDYEVQSDFLKILQLKFSTLFSKQMASNYEAQGFVMNHASTKALVELLHAYLNVVTRFKAVVTLEQNMPGLQFVCETLTNHLTQRDILTQCSIIFWSFIKISRQGKPLEPFELLLQCLGAGHPLELFDLEKVQTTSTKTLGAGILQMAKIRGFVLTMDKEIDIDSAILREVAAISAEGGANIANFILANCEKNEGLQKLYSFQTLDSLVTRLKAVGDELWLTRLSKLLIKNFEYPLHSVSGQCESIMRRLLALCTKEQISTVLGIIKTLSSKHEVKSRFLALHLALEYTDVKLYLKENPHAIAEMIMHTSETAVVGRPVLNYFEAFLKKLWLAVDGKPEPWYAFWIKEYLEALRSDDESLRTSVCTHLTPLVIKIHKMSLAYILSKFLEEHKTLEQNSVGSLESLMTLLKVARQSKMICICDDTKDIRLEKGAQQALSELQEEGATEFSILQSDLLKLLLTQNWKMSLECFQIVAQESRSSLSASTLNQDETKPESSCLVSAFEYQMCETFLQSCVRTTFPEHRQNFMKAIRQFLMSLRGSLTKEIKKYVSDEAQDMSKDVKQLSAFLKRVISFCEENLYVDKPLETALPLFEILKMVQDHFGDYDYHIRVTQVLPALGLLSKEGLMESKPLLMFLLSSLKSSWALVRLGAFDLLRQFPAGHSLLSDKSFVNNVVLKTAMSFCDDPKAMIAEGAGLLLKFLFTKCLRSLDFIDVVEDEKDMQLQFCKHILALISQRLSIFHTTLIKEGKTSALLHGLLSFFKHLFASFKLDCNQQSSFPNFWTAQSEDKSGRLSPSQFQSWREFFNELIETCLETSRVCANLLSNNRLQGEEGGDDTMTVDCRGHPINQAKGAAETEAYADYDNLILVGVWLAVKETGQTLFNLLKWLELPTDEHDDSKFLNDKGIRGLCDSLLNMLFSFRHRGAIEKAAESFSLLNNKLLCSNQAKYQKLPQDMLEQAFERITKENHSTILRRSAGIPPTIIAILRSEPLSNQPVLLNQTLTFLLDLARTSSDQDDSKIHALNIMRFIFQDALLKHDIGRFITPALILATENFKSDNWSIRNSALMCFTSLTKRLLNTTTVQDQDLSRKKGLSIWDFVSRFKELSDYFKGQLRDCRDQKKLNKDERERSDMVIFSILLLISRLVPAFQLTDSSQLVNEDNSEREESKLDTEEVSEDVARHLLQSREQSMHEFISLIKAYATSGTYFVRKISAQALLPIMRFQEYITEIKVCFAQLQCKIKDQSTKLRQNEAHGLMIRINILMHTYFRYRDFNHSISCRSSQEEEELRTIEERQLMECFDEFETDFQKAKEVFSLVIVALFLKSLRYLIKSSPLMGKEWLLKLNSCYAERLKVVLEDGLSRKDHLYAPDEKIFLKDLTKTNLVLQAHHEIVDMSTITGQLKTVLSHHEFRAANIDYVYKFVKAFYSKIKNIKRAAATEALLRELSTFLIQRVLKDIVSLNDENYCKVLEFVLKIIYRINKEQANFKDMKLLELLDDIINKFDVNANLLSLYIKLMALMVNCEDASDLAKIGRIARKYAYADQKELVRVANVKSVARFLARLQDHKCSSSLLDVYMALVLILQDEHPEIRSYLVQSIGINRFVEAETYSIKSPSLASHDAPGKALVVDLNEQVLLESILRTTLASARSSGGDTGVLAAFVNQFLLENFIIGRLYREHQLKNFDDKIFFYEPPNKYCDLLWLQRAAFKLLCQPGVKEHIDVARVQSVLVSRAQAESGSATTAVASPDELELTEACLAFEATAQLHMLSHLANSTGEVAPALNNEFLRSLFAI